MPEIFQQREFHPPTSTLVTRLVHTRTACATLLLASSLATSGCLFGSKKPAKVFIPPPVYAKSPPAAPTKPVELPSPPDAGSAVDPGVEPVVAGNPNLPPAPPKPVPAKPVVAPKPAPTVVNVTPTPATPAPKPTTIFSAEERRRMNQEIDQSLDRVRKALARVEGKNVSAELTALANNARAFMMQAEQARVQDLVTAVSLAKRADLFAADLVQRLP